LKVAGRAAIHDDLPAMDDDDLRRGVPTNHKVFGEALAILAGDWLVAHAFTLLSATPGPRAAEMVGVLARGTEAMVVGQGADNARLVEFVHLHKTARLIEASCSLGALAADTPADDVARLARFGRGLGIAFQIVDDLLDRGGRVERLGKRAGKDQQADKQTFPAAFGEEASRRRAAEEIDGAIAALDHYQARAAPLRELARFVLARDH
jgi:geranylgeranyl diphosphate synthase type II